VLRRPALALLALPLALTACSEVSETAGRASDCAGLVRDVASAGLSGTPSVADAEAAARRLDERVGSIDDARLREATGTLRDRVDALARAARAADPAAVQAAVEEARAAARDTAQLCGVPVDQLLGG
jgi:hypothetical protein